MSTMQAIRRLSAVSGEDFPTNRDRVEAIRVCQTLLAKLQDPFERVWEAVVDTPALVASIKLCLDLDLFRIWKASGNGDKSSHDLAKMVSLKQGDMLGRVLKHLAAHAVIEEVGAETYRPNAFSGAMLSSVKAGIDYFYDTSASLYLTLPYYYRQCGYDPPSDPRDGLFQHAFDCKGQTVFEVYGTRPYRKKSQTFNDWLEAYQLHRPSWTDLYPSHELLDDYTGGPLVIDVGGGLGYDLQLFDQKHPGHASQLVLQDRPDKVAHATCSTEIRRSAHDFFTPQPKSDQGARAYYLHSIIHDYDDCHALKILQHLKDAMVPGYSKLLIHDVIIPPLKASRRDTSVDVHMMAKLGGRERTEDMLTGLVKGLGFRVRKIWRADCSEKSILEAELPLLPRQEKNIA